MKFHRHPRRNCSREPIRAVASSLVAIAAVLGSFPASAQAQGQSYGYSYLRMKISGHPITNLVVDEKYRGWLQILAVKASVTQPVPRAPGNLAPNTKKVDDHWINPSVILRSGRAHSGKIRFGAGDEGGLEPLIDAQKRKSLVASADLDLYDESSGTFFGKYRLKGIRVLSLEDVQASACAMYEITMSFQSAEKVQP
jgi:hypothetical protein